MAEAAVEHSNSSIASCASVLRRVRSGDIVKAAEQHGTALGVVQLGGFGWRDGCREHDIAVQRPVVIELPCLHPMEPVFERWKRQPSDAIQHFEHGEVNGWMDGSHVFAQLSIDDSPLGMRDAARSA
jgi:hypothetical protein